MSAAPVLMLAGPTGSGKTDLAVALAERNGLEIISADSMQVYRGLEIGTAQPSAAQQERVRFHLCGQLDPAEPFNVKRFVELCDAARADILSRGKRPLYVGGTGLYLRALRWGLDGETARDEPARETLEAEIEASGPQFLHARLAGIDPAAAERIAPTDPVRIVRALEVFAATGRKISEQQAAWQSPVARFPHELFILDLDRETLHRRIADRTAAMLAAGWIEETRVLLARGLPPTQHCFKALGYREIIEHLEGKLTRAELEERIIQKTRQFARRQRTWFRRETPFTPLSMDGQAAMDRALAALEKPITPESHPV